jgi:hypothetical protein
MKMSVNVLSMVLPFFYNLFTARLVPADHIFIGETSREQISWQTARF